MIAHTVFVFPTGQIAVCDAEGKQIPELQGEDTPGLRAKIRARSDAATVWHEHGADETYLIWSHEHGKWWGPGGHGYSASIGRAGRYTRQAAIAICLKAIPGTANRLGALPELPVRLADVMALRDQFAAAYPDSVGDWG